MDILRAFGTCGLSAAAPRPQGVPRSPLPSISIVRKWPPCGLRALPRPGTPPWRATARLWLAWGRRGSRRWIGELGGLMPRRSKQRRAACSQSRRAAGAASGEQTASGRLAAWFRDAARYRRANLKSTAAEPLATTTAAAAAASCAASKAPALPARPHPPHASWFHDELPAALRSRQPPHLTQPELVKLVGGPLAVTGQRPGVSAGPLFYCPGRGLQFLLAHIYRWSC